MCVIVIVKVNKLARKVKYLLDIVQIHKAHLLSAVGVTSREFRH